VGAGSRGPGDRGRSASAPAGTRHREAWGRVRRWWDRAQVGRVAVGRCERGRAACRCGFVVEKGGSLRVLSVI
jgi:hypothetical protein